ncbi:recombination regulator RecX [Streptomyces sp. NPDC059445]|uniref:recombination regulator RecX n=1 Tax=unclassified Streptomyces TaxID=2593676 RepID=UPI0036CEDF81
MTRRTDWAEYARPQTPDTRSGQGYGGGHGGPAGDGDGSYDGAGGYGSRSYGTDDGLHEADGGLYGTGGGFYGADGFHGGGPDDGDPDGGGSTGGDARHGDGLPRGHGSPDAVSRRGGRAAGGPRGGRGRRRGGGFGEPSDGRRDGDTPSSSRAEKGESPGDPAERARAICLRLLTGTPRTRKQLADALRKREIPDEVADEVLSRFEEVGLINDSAFADAWVESRHHGRGLARRALVQELRTKGVESTLIDEAVGQLDSEQEEATARELVARKLRSTRGLDRDKRLRRLAGMLARKGYSQGMALRVVRQALEEEGEDTEGLDEGF